MVALTRLEMDLVSQELLILVVVAVEHMLAQESVVVREL
jgi:hypothetical protein